MSGSEARGGGDQWIGGEEEELQEKRVEKTFEGERKDPYTGLISI